MMGDRMNKDGAPDEEHGNSEFSTDYQIKHHLHLSGVLDKQVFSAIPSDDCEAQLDSRASLSSADPVNQINAKKRQSFDEFESSIKRRNTSHRREEDDAIGGKDPPTFNRLMGSPTTQGINQSETSFGKFL
jgi:hypothetical protein